jgi:uncharacterized protein (DUF486 family)
MPVLLQATLLLALSNVFMTFTVFSMRQPLKLDCLWAALCIGGAVFLMFREA